MKIVSEFFKIVKQEVSGKIIGNFACCLSFRTEIVNI